MTQLNKILEKIKHIVQTNPWIGFFLFIQALLLIMGGVIFSNDVVVDEAKFNIILPYQQVVPGWNDSPFLRFITGPWYRFDACRYIAIAVDGYQIDGSELSWPPIYPYFIKGLALFLGNQYILAGMIISQIALIGVCVLLFEEYQNSSNPIIAQRSIRYLLGFPTAFFFFIAYSESLFLLLLLLCWKAGRNEKWFLAGLFGSLATLTRFSGIIILFPLFYLWLRSKGKRELIGILSLTLIPFSLLGWSVFTRLSFGIFPWEALGDNWPVYWDWPWKGFIKQIQLILNLGKDQHIFLLVSLFLGLLFVVIVGYGLKNLPIEYSLLSLGLFIFHLSKIHLYTPLQSISRYILPIFPAYLILARWGEYRWFHIIWSFISIVLFVVLSFMFINGGWVG